MGNSTSWQCPYCGHHQTLSDDSNQFGTTISDYSSCFVRISKYGNVALWAHSIACLNPNCKQLTLKVGLSDVQRNQLGRIEFTNSLSTKKWRLLPDSMAKPQPEYIPEPIRNDYEEACKIAHLSPKATATLARRCLQGMIRDFCQVSEKTLYDEIKKLNSEFDKHQLPQSVTIESIEAIDGVRKIGNIGAHMKFTDDVIVDIEPQEATLLIGLIEMLFKEWYVARHERDERLKDIQKITMGKE